ncbi:MAG: MBL fold metallo-hydrolase [Ruminococcaceae bacterium]|nr:MBL fold metallo-hydrolase [Oscillospiraceae bacterium]
MHDLKIYDVRSVPGDSAFLLDDGKTSILYDSGFAFTGFAVAENIKKVLGYRSLDYIFLTHSHYDHALGSVYAKRYYPDAVVVAGEYASKIFAKDSAKAVMRDLDRKYASKCNVFEYEDLIDDLSVDFAVSDGDDIRAGDMIFKAIHLPGHTKCSFGFYLEKNKLLLGSETIGVYAGKFPVVPSYLIGYDITMQSINKVKMLDIKNVLTPHYGLLDEKTTQKYILDGEKSAYDTAQGILAVLKKGGDVAQAIEYFKEKFYYGYVKEIYPVDAMELNTSIMVNLINKEFLGE